MTTNTCSRASLDTGGSGSAVSPLVASELPDSISGALAVAGVRQGTSGGEVGVTRCVGRLITGCCGGLVWWSGRGERG